AADPCWHFFRPPPDDVAGGILRAARAAAAIPAAREIEWGWAGFGHLSTSPEVFGSTHEPALFGRITARHALVHPLLGGLVAACLGLPEAALWDLVHGDAHWDGARVVPTRDDAVAAYVEAVNASVSASGALPAELGGFDGPVRFVD